MNDREKIISALKSGMIKYVCSTIGLVIIECLNPGISADTRILAIAILMCGYIACKD